MRLSASSFIVLAIAIAQYAHADQIVPQEVPGRFIVEFKSTAVPSNGFGGGETTVSASLIEEFKGEHR